MLPLCTNSRHNNKRTQPCVCHRFQTFRTAIRPEALPNETRCHTVVYGINFRRMSRLPSPRNVATGEVWPTTVRSLNGCPKWACQRSLITAVSPPHLSLTEHYNKPSSNTIVPTDSVFAQFSTSWGSTDWLAVTTAGRVDAPMAE